MTAQGAADEAVTREAVKAALDRYYAWFSAGRADLVAGSAYQAPLLIVQPAGAVTLSTSDAVRAGVDATLAPLLADGYARAEMPSPAISVLGSAAALASGRYVRYRRDGSVMGEYGATYVFARVGTDWKIAAIIAHGADVVLGRLP